MGHLTQWDDSLMFVILCTQILRISCQLPLELIPWTIRMYFYAVIVLCRESRERAASSGRWGPHAWSNMCTCGQVNPIVSFFLQRKD